ncbi:MAG: hypothetical protein M9894_11840 [Planctomycetes bacterium]|nr:hypothetical protein [Planctomycetota bacterium]
MSDDAPDGALPPELQAFAARLVRARRHRGVGPRCERLRFRGEAADRFAAGRELSTTIAGRAAPRWACPPLDPDAIPEAVTKGLRRNQKPFHLWNVERIEEDEPLAFERQQPLRLGAAARLPDELRVPRRIEKATRALKAWLDDQEFHATVAKMDRQRFRRLLREPLPYGRKDDEPPTGGIVIPPPGPGPAVSERVAPFVRIPVPGPRFDDEDDDDRPRRPAFPPGGFDLSQGDDDDGPDDGGGPPALPPFPPLGFDLSQPDDDGDGGGFGLDLSQPED